MQSSLKFKRPAAAFTFGLAHVTDVATASGRRSRPRRITS